MKKNMQLISREEHLRSYPHPPLPTPLKSIVFLSSAKYNSKKRKIGTLLKLKPLQFYEHF
jgi:hypothetical protein